MSKNCKNARNTVLGVWITLICVIILCSSCSTTSHCPYSQQGAYTYNSITE